ncbi:MAG: type II toxin-antitoxin system RelE/ParE family toxin [Flavobacteriales bacterium]|jgi:plasmid stabilization system protein ParE|nr:type II toxin-antitoxin system RelE/ParE family toxin [Flavobacteriales bacterium]
MGVERFVLWSDEATEQVDATKTRIGERWSDKEVESFLDLLQRFEDLVKRFPNGYERSRIYPGCRRAVIHPNVSVVYRVNANDVEVVTVYDNRSARSQR